MMGEFPFRGGDSRSLIRRDQRLPEKSAPRLGILLTSELLTWLVGKVSAFCLRMRGRDRITHAKLSTREQRVCLVAHVAKSFENSRSICRSSGALLSSKSVNLRPHVPLTLCHLLIQLTPPLLHPS